ncbi:MAG TPA: glycosyltransferase family 2 protein [Candidatus Methylomirabilis sp.]|nr:glycosyltransferase family 2 protein [Candidatus Methylomirabilis sp.]
MKVSFVVPAYNEAAAIGTCLDSIFREAVATPYTTEVIVVDNASTDSTAAVAGGYPGVVVVPEPRKGITFARQAGLAKSSGDLVANVDADTMLTPGWLETACRAFAEDERLVCLSGPVIYYDAPRFVRFWTWLFYLAGFTTYLMNRFVLRAGSMVQGGNFVCRRSALGQVGGYNTAIDFYGEDTDIAQRLHRVGRVKFTFRLPIYASGRRLAAEGLIATGARYALNYFWVLLLGRPFTRRSTDVRPSRVEPRGSVHA